MKKRIFSLLCAILVISFTAAPVSAQTPGDEAANVPELSAISGAGESEGFSVSVSDGVIGTTASEPTEVQRDEDDGTTVSATGLYPFEINYENHNGAPVIIKSFKVPPGFDAASLVEEDFTEDGFIYSKKDILMSEPETLTVGKTVAEPISFMTEDNEQATLLSTLAPVIDYNEGGYSGQLTLDYASILSAVAGEESYSYPIKRTVEVNNLADNDYAYLDKDMNGLTLVSADWDLRNGVQRAETMIPGHYTAYATYTGTGYGTRVTGYLNTAYYTGYVTRTYEGNTIYSIVYKGIQDPATVSNIPWTGIFIVLGLLALAGGVAMLLLFKIIPAIRNRNNGGGTPPVQVPH